VNKNRYKKENPPKPSDPYGLSLVLDPTDFYVKKDSGPAPTVFKMLNTDTAVSSFADFLGFQNGGGVYKVSLDISKIEMAPPALVKRRIEQVLQTMEKKWKRQDQYSEDLRRAIGTMLRLS
jgi:hypothetical protein